MKNPWETGDHYGNIRCAWIDTQSRLDRAKRFTSEQLRAAIAWPDTQKSVRLFMERRLRRIERSAAERSPQRPA